MTYIDRGGGGGGHTCPYTVAHSGTQSVIDQQEDLCPSDDGPYHHHSH